MSSLNHNSNWIEHKTHNKMSASVDEFIFFPRTLLITQSACGPSHSAFHDSFSDGGSTGEPMEAGRHTATTARWDDVLMMSGADNRGHMLPLPPSISQSQTRDHLSLCGISLIWSESSFAWFGGWWNEPWEFSSQRALAIVLWKIR